MVQVLKNVAIMGGLLKFIVDGAGTISLDSRMHHALLVKGPILEIPIQKVNLQFDSRIAEPLGSLGTVYQDVRIADIWGSLTVSKRALINPAFSAVYVPAPPDPTTRPIQGDGWTLDLASGWTTVAKEGTSDLVLAQSGY